MIAAASGELQAASGFAVLAFLLAARSLSLEAVFEKNSTLLLT
ncbi:hypothetical protein [Pseudomonas sp. B21-028]|jgi:hypothetical protein|nr:hypothetical protein [Pseudomonas sp. B21-028]